MVRWQRGQQIHLNHWHLIMLSILSNIVIWNDKLRKSFVLDKFLLLWLKNLGQRRSIRFFLKFSSKIHHPLMIRRLKKQGVLAHQQGLIRRHIVMILGTKISRPNQVHGQGPCQHQRWIVWRSRTPQSQWLVIGIMSPSYRSTKGTSIHLLVLKLFCF